MSKTALELALKALINSTPKPLPTDDDYADGAWFQHFGSIKAVREAIEQSPDAVLDELEKRAEFNRNARKSIDRMLNQYGFTEDSSIRHSLACMNFNTIVI